jgi:hypothetical protein
MFSSCLRSVMLIGLVAVLYGSGVANSMARSATGAPGPGSGSGPGGGGHAPPGAPGAPDGGASVQSVSQTAEQAVGLCDIHTPRCIADALDDYATALRALGPLLPREFNDLPAIVERAATKVRTARTKKEAISAVQSAIAEVHKRIALLRADDPVTLKVGTRDGAFVIQTLQVADDKLEKAVGL